ncbi:ShlB/FhaC/HecB family hemolysin secretion/activation protein [Novosphingobium sp. FKTRR1]|uniref:ShlB/FhaC/HecB family hemolysin secretion/activation protein n=1 Tax=Novosphingobium sp. FKTRR1 TaxID=2879118 RepID=UPI001CEFC731|nr:ShlB/FhaC/HecB family hemolysin secretion/activation protein [Novosphingobium sp. FKTRR1]
MKTLKYLALALFAPAVAHGQQMPNAGSQLQQLPQPQIRNTPEPEFDIAPRLPTVAPAPGGPSVHVVTLHVAGEAAFSEAELVKASGFVAGANLTLQQMRDLAARIADLYHRQGYFLAQTYLPEQDVQDGSVTISVIEGHYGKIDIHNQARIADQVPAGVLHGLKAGDPIINAPLERRLLLLSDIPGVRVKSTLAPGAAVGTSDLTVTLARGPLISGDVEADNAGSRYTGIYRFGGTINVNNPLGIGDQFSLRGLGSDGGLAYLRASYQVPLDKLTVGIAYAHLHYSLGREFAALDGTGTADIFSAYGSYPLVRSRRANLYALANVDYKLLHDRVGVVSTHLDRRITAATFGLAGDSRDTLGGGGSNVYSLGWTIGKLNIRSPIDRAIDAATARSEGTYNKVQGGFSRNQAIAGPLSLFVSVRGQAAFKNLDSSEKIELGGAYGVRAYPEGEAFGDSGYIATIEPRLMLGGDSRRLPGRFELIAFVDTGEIRFAHDPWFSGSNHARRSGYGVGVNWAGPEGLLVRVSYARRLGTGPATSAPMKDGRFWFQVVKQF